MPVVELPVAGIEVGVLPVALLGLVVGCLAGLFGVGGGFLMTPMLNVLFGIPYNFAIGSDLAQMLGMSAAGGLRHRKLGNVDFRLGAMAAVGVVPGVEVGAQILQVLKGMGSVPVGGAEVPVTTLVLSVVYIALLGWISGSMWRESRRTLAASLVTGEAGEPEPSRLGRRLRNVRRRPMIALPASGIESISFWALFAVALATGLASGLLGVGGGFIFLPALIYVVGVPTTVAVGTSLLTILFASAYGTLTHSFKGNVDLLLVMILLVPSAIGTQIGATMTRRLGGARARRYFSLVAGAAMIIVGGKLLVLLLGQSVHRGG